MRKYGFVNLDCIIQFSLQCPVNPSENLQIFLGSLNILTDQNNQAKQIKHEQRANRKLTLRLYESLIWKHLCTRCPIGHQRCLLCTRKSRNNLLWKFWKEQLLNSSDQAWLIIFQLSDLIIRLVSELLSSFVKFIKWGDSINKFL